MSVEKIGVIIPLTSKQYKPYLSLIYNKYMGVRRLVNLSTVRTRHARSGTKWQCTGYGKQSQRSRVGIQCCQSQVGQCGHIGAFYVRSNSFSYDLELKSCWRHQI